MTHSSDPMNSSSDDDLVIRARAGHQEAFNLLMERHRRQALHWAQQITNDPHLAEDIVQEGLISAFTYLGSLEQIEKFIPWFRRIIMNQALMQVRRGGPYAKERPFSSYLSPASEYSSENFQQIEFILGTLARNAAKQREQEDDPTEALIRRDTYEMLREMLCSLRTRDREVFEAHFFKHYTPQEIAAMYSTTSGNIYTILSRTRQKISQARYESNLNSYLQSRSSNPSLSLDRSLPEQGMYIGEIWDSFALCVMHALQYTDSRDRYTMDEIMGLSGQAFRLQIHEDQIDLGGVTAFHWRNIFSKGLLNLGFAPRSIGDGMRIPQSHELLVEAFSFIHHTLDQGQPVIVWGVKLPYFALIHGYDDQRRLFRVTGLFEHTHLSYDQLGRDWSADLFAISLGTPISVSPLESLRGALGLILTHADGNERTPRTGYVQGLSAYNTWIKALSSGTADPLFHAYQVWYAANIRAYAVQFLERVACRIPDYGHQICLLAGEAASHYRKVAASLHQLRALFPFPGSGKPEPMECRNAGLRLLEQAKSNEAQGLQILKTIFLLLCDPKKL